MSNSSRYLGNITTLDRLRIPKLHRVVCSIIAILLVATAAVLWFTPWTQTAFGTGTVDSLNPFERTQAISALTSGQIKQWHVREGMQVKKGEPIVTLIDIDAERLDKLQAQLAATSARYEADSAAVANARSNLERQQSLLEQGLVSPKAVETAEIKMQELKAKAAKSEADINSVSMTLSRQATQTKVAPSDGTIVSLLSGGGSTFVKEGDILARFIPSGVTRTVRISVSGLDAPLVQPGSKVRLQFEGWPVIQFSGWPGTAVGTFGGVVVYVEPVADATGRFQVWVSRDESDIPWPDENSVRLGSRVQAWVLLEEVRLGYELWRQLNNFPPKPTAPVKAQNGALSK
ncbi:efflux RND transporter periplasmic adaptor subunit [Alteromonas halophila]|uniref:Membrane protein n=1 Tax=Alteromonas halophila TaxID=516698 RepID=A0A918JLJ9_9ALTE|nr:biotin/lipoyl-binding protein [Alteromonas halophila]GGW82176.1 membrane protein [Alteromonas halophila]